MEDLYESIAAMAASHGMYVPDATVLPIASNVMIHRIHDGSSGSMELICVAISITLPRHTSYQGGTLYTIMDPHAIHDGVHDKLHGSAIKHNGLPFIISCLAVEARCSWTIS